MAVGLWFLLGNLGVDLPGFGQLWPVFLILGGVGFMVSFFRHREAGVLIPGCGSLGLGLFFLAITVGPLRWSDLGDWWPIFPMIGGLAFITTFAFGREREPGLLVPGLGGFLVGCFFFLYTLGVLDWDDMGLHWPAFPLIGGLTFLGLWLADMRKVGILIPAGLGIAVGVFGFIDTLWGISFLWLFDAWPIALILLGLIIIVRGLWGRRPEG